METQTLNSPALGQIALIQKKLSLEANLRGGTNWFFWVAALSLVNSIIYYAGGSLNFVVGLGATQLIDGIATALAKDLSANGGTIIRLVGLAFDVAIAGMFLAAGLLARKRYRWAHILGMVLYAFDGILFIVFGGWLSVAFHGFALFGLFRGLTAINALKTFDQTTPVSMPVVVEAAKGPWHKSTSARTLFGLALMFLCIIAVLVAAGFVLKMMGS